MGIRDLAIMGGSSHPEFVQQICDHLGIQQIAVELGKFSNKESKVHIQHSVRGKHVVIIQSGCGSVNDNLVELMIMLAACKISSAKSVVAVLPCFPYARQPDVPYEKNTSQILRYWTPQSAGLNEREDSQLEIELTKKSKKSILYQFSKSVQFSPTQTPTTSNLSSTDGIPTLEAQVQNIKLAPLKDASEQSTDNGTSDSKAPKPKLFLPMNKPSISDIVCHSAYSTPGANDHQTYFSSPMYFPSTVPKNTGYKHWTARAGTLIANLLIESGANRIITMDLHDAQFQGYFDVPVEHLYSEAAILNYIRDNVPNYQNAVIVSPDAGGAKRATSISKKLNLKFAMIHKDGKSKENIQMSLVGNVQGKVAIIIDDIADTCGTLGLAAEVLQQSGATHIHAIVTHGMLTGPAIDVINQSKIDTVAVTNTIPQVDKLKLTPKLKVIDVSTYFAEAIRRVYHGESLAGLLVAP